MMYYNYIFVVFLLRVFLGILFFSQGYDKVFRVGVKRVIDTFDNPLENRKLPKWLIIFAGIYTSYVELIGGLLLALGFLTNFTLYFLGIDLLMVCIAFSLMKPMWDMQFVFPRLLLLVILLIVPIEWNVFSIDHFFNINESILVTK